MPFDPKKFERDRAGAGRERRVLKHLMTIEKRAAAAAAEGAEPDADDVGPGAMKGHASVFSTPASLGYFVETVLPGAFTKTIADDDIRALFNHDPNLILGRNTAGTLKLSEDDIGLAFEIDLPPTQLARDLSVSVDRKDISQCSIGFMVNGAEWREEVVDGETIWYRDLTEIALLDVSPVTFPAFVSTDVSMRSAADVFKDFRSGPGMKESDPIGWQLQSEARRRLLMIAEQL